MNSDSITKTLENVISVSELNHRSKSALEQSIGLTWVTGEISNLAQPMSGHCYFSLKDSQSQVRCACFRGVKSTVNFALENGQQIIVMARVSLYEPRGDYQLIVQKILLAGDGLLQIKFNQLKKLCEQKGWFRTEHKKMLPKNIHTLGIITSSTGAAIQDVIKVLRRRSPLLSLIIYPTLVQGAQAAPSICQAIRTANKRNECDVLLLGRGGGSLEDLWCFNDESVAEEIFNSTIPIITGIGHEVDTTIADWVADTRAATPSAAAEVVSPDQEETNAKIRTFHTQMVSLIQHRINTKQVILEQLEKRLRHPGEKLREHSQTIDQLEIRMSRQMSHLLEIYKTTLYSMSQRLNTLSPLNTLARGFTITRDSQNCIVSSIDSLATEDQLRIQFKDGKVLAEIKEIQHPVEESD